VRTHLVSPGKHASAWAESAATILTATGSRHTGHAGACPQVTPAETAVALPVRLSPNRMFDPGKIHSLACAHRAGRNPEGTITMTSTKHKANKEESKCRIGL
jgi:hypothetical protein